MDISAFIRELLFSHDCVIVPGFGGFISNYLPARVDEASFVFYPPVKQISFNRQLDHNDGLLIARISQSASIDYNDAKIRVEEYVKELHRELSKGEEVRIDHVGSFMRNHEYNIQFEPDIGANYNLATYNLDSFQYYPLERYDVRKRIRRHIDKVPVTHSSFRKNLLKVAAAIPLIALLVFITTKSDFLNSGIEAVTLNPLVTAEFENNRNAIENESSVLQVDNNKSGVTPREESAVSPDLNAVPEEQVLARFSEETNYLIITGSFKSEENALSHVKSLKAQGFTPEILFASNGFYRVSAMKSGDINRARSVRDSILKQYPGTWICRE